MKGLPAQTINQKYALGMDFPMATFSGTHPHQGKPFRTKIMTTIPG